MPNIHDLGETTRRVLHIFYVLDTSGSMEGIRIATLNRAMRETLDVLKQKAQSNADALVKIAVLEFNSNVRWLNPAGPEAMEDFIWEDLKTGGLTSMGAALKELNTKLSRMEFLKSMTGAYLPVMIFMTDGHATDDYKLALNEISQNKWFARGTKIGFAIGDNPDTEMIANIVGTGEAVITTNDLTQFARHLRTVSVTASMLCSTSRTTADAVSGSRIVRDVVNPTVRDSDAVDPTDIVDPDAPAPAPEPEPVTPDPFDGGADAWGDVDFLDFD